MLRLFFYDEYIFISSGFVNINEELHSLIVIIKFFFVSHNHAALLKTLVSSENVCSPAKFSWEETAYASVDKVLWTQSLWGTQAGQWSQSKQTLEQWNSKFKIIHFCQCLKKKDPHTSYLLPAAKMQKTDENVFACLRLVTCLQNFSGTKNNRPYKTKKYSRSN